LEELDRMISITSEPININRNKEHVSANLFESVILKLNVNYIDHNQFTEFMEIGDGISPVHKKYLWQNTELTVFLKRFVVDINLDSNAIQELVNKNSTNILVYDGKMIITGFHLMDLLCKRDKRKDIYNLGLILWELYSGRPPEKSNLIYEGEDCIGSSFDNASDNNSDDALSGGSGNVFGNDSPYCKDQIC
ncbi:42_t:CDS:2, partial [Gigaspora rosea]